jgi:hypothetical protein
VTVDGGLDWWMLKRKLNNRNIPYFSRRTSKNCVLVLSCKQAVYRSLLKILLFLQRKDFLGRHNSSLLFTASRKYSLYVTVCVIAVSRARCDHNFPSKLRPTYSNYSTVKPNGSGKLRKTWLLCFPARPVFSIKFILFV